jgi:hypothetical protein
MASTRNRNTPGNYANEQTMYRNRYNFLDYNESSFYGVQENTCFAGNGLVGMKTANRNLSNNYCDIESFLFGIGSTNLANPQEQILPSIKQLPSLDICERIPFILPQDFVPLTNQRPETNYK